MNALNVDPGLCADAAAVLGAHVEVVRREADARHAPRAVLRHGDDLTGARRDHRDGGELPARIRAGNVLVGGGLGRLLRRRHERRADGETPAAQQLLAVRRRSTEGGIVAQLPVHVVAEERRVRRRAPVRRLARLEELLRRDLPGRGCECRGDVSDVGHRVEDLDAAPLRRVRVARRVVRDRLLHGTGEGRRLGERQLARMLGEVAEGRGLDAVGARPEVRDVEVALEDLVLGEDPLQGHGVTQLLELAADGARACGRRLLGGGRALDEHVLHVLLGQGRTALRAAVARRVADRRAQEAAGIDAAVVVEAPVLDGDDRLAHHERHCGQRYLDAVLLVDGRDHRAVRREDARPLRERRRDELRGQRLVVLDRRAGRDARSAHERQGRSRHHHAGHDAHEQEEPQAGERGDHRGLPARCGGAGRGIGGRHGPQRVRRGDGRHLLARGVRAVYAVRPARGWLPRPTSMARNDYQIWFVMT